VNVAIVWLSPPKYPWVYAEWFDGDEPMCVCVYPSGTWENVIDGTEPGPEDHYASLIDDYWRWHFDPSYGPLAPLSNIRLSELRGGLLP
jgi:hypothetical protein